MQNYPYLPILIIDDEEKHLVSLRDLLESGNINNIVLCNDSRETMHLMEKQEFSIILLDYKMPFLSGKEVLAQIKTTCPMVPVIIISAISETNEIVEFIKSGAFDYFTKPVENEKLFFATINRAISSRETALENMKLKKHLLNNEVEHPEVFHKIITRDEEMLRIFQYCESIAPGPAPVLITGSSGVGKDLLAKALHELSGRKGRFIPVNIAGLENDNLFSDTLFGHLKGAFTGATTNRNGLVEEAYGGTLFLDEIGDLDHASQVKLLRLIQEKEYYKLGSDLLLKAEIRVIAATNANLVEKMKKNEFRQDLFFRLKIHNIHLPRLIDRKGDLYLLIHHLIEQASKDYGKSGITLSDDTMELLNSYNYPGNIRDLEAIITDAVACCRNGNIEADSVKRNMDPDAFSTGESIQDEKRIMFSQKLPTIKEVVDFLVVEALHRAGNNLSQAGRLVGCTHEAIRKRVKNLNLPDGRVC